MSFWLLIVGMNLECDHTRQLGCLGAAVDIQEPSHEKQRLTEHVLQTTRNNTNPPMDKR